MTDEARQFDSEWWEMPDYHGLLERLAGMPKEVSGAPSRIIAAYDDIANEASRLLTESPHRIEPPCWEHAWK